MRWQDEDGNWWYNAQWRPVGSHTRRLDNFPGERVRLAHDLRHFYASALIAGGASVKQVQERLGHASAVITLKTYAHLWPGDDDRTRAP